MKKYNIKLISLGLSGEQGNAGDWINVHEHVHSTYEMINHVDNQNQ